MDGGDKILFKGKYEELYKEKKDIKDEYDKYKI